MDYKKEYERIVNFIEETNDKLGTIGGVVGLSGGIDSSLCAKLIVDALGNDKCTGIIMPAKDSNPKDEEDAQSLAEYLNIRTIYHPVENLLKTFEFEERDFEELRSYLINLQSLWPPQIELPYIMKLRGRMYIATYYARKYNFFQCQTLEKTEWVLGWFDKFGDAAGDIAPIMHLLKTEVFELARYLELPDLVLNRKPTSGNFPMTDEEELQMKYPEETDIILYRLANGFSIYDIEAVTKISLDKIKRIKNLVDISQVKRDIPLWIH